MVVDGEKKKKLEDNNPPSPETTTMMTDQPLLKQTQRMTPGDEKKHSVKKLPLKQTQRMIVDGEKQKKKKLHSCESQKPTYFGYSVYYLSRPIKLIFKNEVRLFPCGSLDADIRMGVSQISDADKAALTKSMNEVVQACLLR